LNLAEKGIRTCAQNVSIKEKIYIENLYNLKFIILNKDFSLKKLINNILLGNTIKIKRLKVIL